MGLQGRKRRIKTHNIHFTDHAGRDALMVFEGRDNCPLPPLYGFSMYFVHPAAKPQSIKPAALLDAIRPFRHERCPFRLDLYFLAVPENSDIISECINHFGLEKEARGHYMRQIHAIENATAETDSVRAVHGLGKGLPGMVPSYIDPARCDYYHALLWLYDGPDWATDCPGTARRCGFDPVSHQEYTTSIEGTEEPDTLAPVYVASDAFRDDGDTGQGMALIGMRMFEISLLRTENETNGPWQQAVERGWMTW
jgi:hypothetical protein